jgi:DNA-binding MarR family transcriptional regulator
MGGETQGESMDPDRHLHLVERHHEEVTEQLREGLNNGEACIIVKRNRYYKERHFVGFQEAFNALAEADLSKRENQILMKLLTLCDWENWVQVPQADLAEMLNMRKQHVSRALISLEKMNFIRSRKVGRSKFYQLNPHFVWKGEFKAREKALHEKDDKGNLIHLPLPGIDIP